MKNKDNEYNTVLTITFMCVIILFLVLVIGEFNKREDSLDRSSNSCLIKK